MCMYVCVLLTVLTASVVLVSRWHVAGLNISDIIAVEAHTAHLRTCKLGHKSRLFSGVFLLRLFARLVKCVGMWSLWSRWHEWGYSWCVVSHGLSPDKSPPATLQPTRTSHTSLPTRKRFNNQTTHSFRHKLPNYIQLMLVCGLVITECMFQTSSFVMQWRALIWFT